MEGNRDAQARYISAHVECGGVKSRACDKSGVDRATLYTWLKSDDVFKQNLKDAEDKLYETLVAAGIERAARKSDTLLIFFLKARYPEIYDDNYRKVQWEKNAEAELRDQHPLPQIIVMGDPKPEQPK
jgi:hypothetical protein